MAVSRRVLLPGDSAAALCPKQLIHTSRRALSRPGSRCRYIPSSTTANRLAGDVFGWQASLPWEFTNDNPVNSPIRSILPIWMVYGLPMRFIKQLYGCNVPAPASTDASEPRPYGAFPCTETHLLLFVISQRYLPILSSSI
jgi:hypothetical protein